MEKNQTGLENYVFGKVQPQAIPLEEAVLGALMLDRDALAVVTDILMPESFYLEAHQHIYRACIALFNASHPIDLLTVTEALRNAGVLESCGGPYYLVELSNRVASAANIEYHARIIAQKHIQRGLISISTQTLKEAYQDTTDVFDLLDGVEKSLFALTSDKGWQEAESAFTIGRQVLINADRAMTKRGEGGITGVTSGLKDLDMETGGWQPSDLIIIAARPGMGKCLGKGTMVLMFDGSLKNVEDVSVGDQLMGDDSTPRNVLSVTSGFENMYWVRQKKGIDYRVNESHILSLKASRNEGVRKHGDVVNISVEDLIKKSAKFQSNLKGYKVGVEFEAKELEIEPYFLGLWLGDGSKDKVTIHNPDAEVKQYLEAYAERLGLQLSVYDAICPAMSITKGRNGNGYSLKAHMKKLNLIGNKHIPKNYLINSTENRLQLLAGLLDSDGYMYGSGFEISQKDEGLARQIKFLADSLGFRTFIGEKTARISSLNYEAQVFKVLISGNTETIPTKIKRKQSPGSTAVDHTMTGITIEPDGYGEYFGFEIDGNRLFLLSDMTVTHNTALAVNTIAVAAARSKKPVGLFSMEMSKTQLGARILSGESGVSSRNMANGDLHDSDFTLLQDALEGIEGMMLYIDDTPGLSIATLRAKARRMKMKYDISLFIIDYLQLMNNAEKGGNREQEISNISRGLKALAKELDVPVIALSQLSRAVETRGGSKRPQLSDLRDSGAIEQDADIVMFIYRPEYYDILEDDKGNSTEGLAELIIAKHRNGALVPVMVKFEGRLTKFSDLPKTTPFQPTPTGPTVPVYNPAESIRANRVQDEDTPF